jgi:hypothetical protein
VCGYYPPGSNSFTVRPNNATLSYHRPIVSLLNATTSAVCMGSLVSDTSNNNSLYEIAIIDNRGKYRTSITRPGAYQIHSIAMNDFIFATYATSTASQMDVLYYGVSTIPLKIDRIEIYFLIWNRMKHQLFRHPLHSP